jgi:hypothetical protein
MSTPTDALFHHERRGFSLTVYPNRIDTMTKAVLTTKRETILLRNVTNVEINGLVKKLHITTNDGTTRAYFVGPDPEPARQAILSAL